jgi:hypothetical protein
LLPFCFTISIIFCTAQENGAKNKFWAKLMSGRIKIKILPRTINLRQEFYTIMATNKEKTSPFVLSQLEEALEERQKPDRRNADAQEAGATEAERRKQDRRG